MIRPLLYLLALFWFSPLAAAPNLVLIVADDLGYGETGAQGNDDIPTPHIDSIAENGVRFTQGYVTAAYCSASRAGLMTGRYQTRFGYEFNPTGYHNEDPDAGLPVSERTLADFLRESGYITGIFGKWHLGGTAKYNPIRRGFDDFFGFLHEGHYFVPPPYDGHITWERRKVLPGGSQGRWTSPNGRMIYSTHIGRQEPDYDANNPILLGGQPVEETENLTDAFSREAVKFIERNHSVPFFLYLPYNAVHSPLQGQDDYMEKFAHIDDVQRQIFAAMLAQMDDGIGRVLAALEEHELEEDTLVFFISDNGGPTRELTSSNAPLSGEKGSVYEGGIRVPFFAQWKGQISPGSVYEEPVISLDIFATITALANSSLDGKTRDGVNLMPFLKGEKAGAPHEQLYWRLGNRTALRRGDWKLLRNPVGQNQKEWQLYDLGEDIGESNDLAASQPEKLAEMIASWETMNGEMIPSFWSPGQK